MYYVVNYVFERFLTAIKSIATYVSCNYDGYQFFSLPQEYYMLNSTSK